MRPSEFATFQRLSREVATWSRMRAARSCSGVSASVTGRVPVDPTPLLGAALCAVLWFAFSGPFPLAEFCTRRRPTWVLGLLDTPRYTAMTGPVFLGAMAALTVLPSGILARAACSAAVVGRVAAGAGAAGPGGRATCPRAIRFSQAFKYIFDGRIMAVYGENPFIKVPADSPG